MMRQSSAVKICSNWHGGQGTEYHKHEVYGYEIPYITEATPDETANKVKVISYMK